MIGWLGEAYEKGYAKGIAKGVLHQLARRGLTPTDLQRQRIESCTDHNELLAWLDNAVEATTVDAVFLAMKPAATPEG